MRITANGAPVARQPARPRWLAGLAAAALGFTAVLAQLTLFRELLGAFAGNELVLGVLLANWLFAGGAGAAAARLLIPRLKRPAAWLAIGLAAAALLPATQALALRALRNHVILPGTAAGVGTVFTLSLGVLLPYCLLDGFLIPLAAAVARAGAAASDEPRAARQIYAADCAGSVAGGLLFTFLLVTWLEPLTGLAIPLALDLGVALAVGWHGCGLRSRTVAALTAAFAVAAAVILPRLAALSTDWLYPGERVVARIPSAYESLVVTQAAGRHAVYGNGIALYATDFPEAAEETAHLPLAQRLDAQAVLLVGGGVEGVDRELLKHQLRSLDCLEVDPALVGLADRFISGPAADPRRRRLLVDGRLWLNQGAAGRRYDVVIFDLPPPDTLQSNRFYTAEAFAAAKAVLTPGGVLALPIGEYYNYIGPDLAALLACGRATAQTAFRNVRLLPAGQILLLASDGELTAEIGGRLAQARIPVRLLTRHYLDTMLAPDRLADLERAAAAAAPVNRDFQPFLFRLHLRHWLGRAGGGRALLLPAGLAAVLCLACLFWQRPAGRLIFATGFTASSLSVVLLLGLQTLFGALYRQVGLVVTLFMAGLAAGAWAVERGAAGKRREWLLLPGAGIALALAAAALPWGLRASAALGGLATAGAWAGQALLALAAFALGGLTGAQFPLAVRREAEQGAGGATPRLYAADLLGASLGALLAGTLLIPTLGLAGTCQLCAAFNLLLALPLAWPRRPA
ncbi:MAG: fused MFS/spermidine synthase [Lentisphaeria bacterium]|jgi:spermidine synthase